MKKKIIISIIILVIAALGVGALLSKKDLEPAFDSGTLHCILDINDFDNANVGLISGYNYCLLTKFAEDNGMKADIRLSEAGATYQDSLDNGALDILVLPSNDTYTTQDSGDSDILDDMTRWVTSSAFPGKKKCVDEWITAYMESEEHDHLFDLYINVYEPFLAAKTGVHKSELGPYDSLIRAGADTLGWDWRLLTAVIFQESRFRINARSVTGALGLMQVVKRTAGALGIDNILDPEENINAGVSYLLKLQKIFRKYAASESDLQKFSLVAYNIGENKLKEILETSLQDGVECSTWDQLDELLCNNEISTYIRKIFNYYWAFCRIYREPEITETAMRNGQTGQDQPLQ